MKEKYTTPEMEIVEFEEEACVTMSGNGPEGDNIVDSNHMEWDTFDGGETWE